MTPAVRHPLPAARWPDETEARTARLFAPLRLRSGLELRHRTWIPAMVPWRATDEGFVTPAILDWYRRFAEGRPAVLVVEATGIRDVPSGPLLRIGHDRFVPGLTELADAVREASEGHTRLFIQVIDFLAIRRRPDPQRYLRDFLMLRDDHRDAARRLAPDVDAGDDQALRDWLCTLDEETLGGVLSDRERDDLTRGYRERVDDLHLPHIRRLPTVLPDLFADAARRARRAGFDGVELHYAHAYTMASFLSRLNQRDDGYGGSPEARIRLPLEVLERVRQRVGRDYTVGARMLGDEVVPGGSRLEDACGYAVALAGAGIDFLSISRGGKFEDARPPRVGQAAYPYTGPSGHACMPSVFDDEPPFGRNLHLAAGIRRAVRAAGHQVPIVASGAINDFDLAETALRDGDADLIAAARQSLADPDWFEKVRTGRGDEVQRCLYTNYCEALDQQHREVTCQLWDRLLEFGDEPSLSADGRRRLVAPRGAWSARVRPS